MLSLSLIRSMTQQCLHCSAAFASDKYLSHHLQRRHPHADTGGLVPSRGSTGATTVSSSLASVPARLEEVSLGVLSALQRVEKSVDVKLDSAAMLARQQHQHQFELDEQRAVRSLSLSLSRSLSLAGVLSRT